MRVLYATRMSGYTVDHCFDDVLRDAKEDQNLIFCRKLCTHVAAGDDRIDASIRGAVQKWDLGRLAIIDLIILRIAVAEFLYFDDIPYKVTINEAIELAKEYSTGQSGRFVNGILDAICADLKKNNPRREKLETMEPR